MAAGDWPALAYGRRRAARSGLTLVELLVVVFLLSIITATTIPLLVPAVEGRRIREASRGLSSFLAGARGGAIERGRPVGVRIVSTGNEPFAAMEAIYVEVPPLYAGDTVDAKAKITAYDQGTRTMTVALSDAAGAAKIVRYGDLVRLNYQGPWWVIVGGSSGALISSSTITLSVPANYRPSYAANNGAWLDVPFQIRRQPVSAPGSSFQMPDGVAIDIRLSGIGTGVFPIQNPGGTGPRGDVTILFAPEGHVETVFDAAGNSLPVDGAIFLLVGRIEKVKPPTSDLDTTSWSGADWTPENCNLLDLLNQWVSINPANGQAIAAEMKFVDPEAVKNGDLKPGDAVNLSRQLARDQRGMSSR